MAKKENNQIGFTKAKDESKKQSPVNFFAFGANINNTPRFSEAKNKDWIPYGNDNQYPEYLVDILNSSSKHNSIVKRKVDMTAGNGFQPYPHQEFLDNPNGTETLEEIAFKNAYDLMVYGAYAVAITWSKDKQSIARMKFVDARQVRICKELDDDSEIAQRQAKGVEFYYISPDWNNIKQEKNVPKIIQGFSEEFKDEPTQLIYVKEYRVGTDFYTLPDYVASVDWIELDKEIANFHLSSVHNGFTPSMVISFNNGIPTEEEQRKFSKKVQQEYAGSDNGSRVFLTFSESNDTSPTFLPINLNSSDDRFLQLEEQIMQNIIVSHGASPLVAGVATAGKLGSSDEIFEAEVVFQNRVIDSKQLLLENTYNMIAEINGLEGTLELKTVIPEDAEEPEVEAIDEEAKARAALKGSVGGVQGILSIQAAVSQGITSPDAGAAILELIYGIGSAEAQRMLAPAEAKINEPIATGSTETNIEDAN